MPNHVSNTLSITGPEQDVRAFHAAVSIDRGEDSGIIRTFLPFPTELEGKDITDKNGDVVGRAFSDEGYNWCLKNWGTKWGDYDTDVVSEPSEIIDGDWQVIYSYDTAWSPADAAIITIAKQFPNLTFAVSWQEEGFQSCGALVAKGENHVSGYVSEDAFPDFPDWDDEGACEKFREEWSELIDAAQGSAFRQLADLIDA